MIEREPIKVYRTPVKRKPIISKESFLKHKLQELENLSREGMIWGIIRHYDMLVCESTNKVFHTSVSFSSAKMERNWRYFEQVYELCKLKDWDAKLYIESQFDRCKGWSKFPYPLPLHLISVNAMKYFTNYLSTLKQKYEKDIRRNKKEKGKETLVGKQKIMDGIISSVETLDRYIKQSNYPDLQQYKAVRIFQSWGELSPYYLYSVPWFRTVLYTDLEGNIVEKYRKEFESIDKSSYVKDIIEKTVQQVERHYNLPDNINLT